jgi:hypothetical protein
VSAKGEGQENEVRCGKDYGIRKMVRTPEEGYRGSKLK